LLPRRRNFLHLKQAAAAGKVKSVTIRGSHLNPLSLTLINDLHVAAGGVMTATAMVWSAHPGGPSALMLTACIVLHELLQFKMPSADMTA
jgi:hypothetical protein